MKNPLVSVIVPTYNSAQFLDACLKSIKEQSYSNIELIVVDNNSTDSTKEIAKKYTRKVLNKGPERSAQRNYGVSKAAGQYVLIIDSDMELSPKVAETCVSSVAKDPKLGGVVIPEESFGEGFWAQCKKLERSFYVGVEWMEAARFFPKRLYLQLGGYNESLVSGEDWDLSQRVGANHKIGRVHEFIYHNEGSLQLSRLIAKKYYYAKHFAKYKAQGNASSSGAQTSIISRYALLFSRPRLFLVRPFHMSGMLVMKTLEFGAGAIGYTVTNNEK